MCRGLDFVTGQPLEGRFNTSHQGFHFEPTKFAAVGQYNALRVVKCNLGYIHSHDSVKSVVEQGSVVKAVMRLFWQDSERAFPRGLDIKLKRVGGSGEPFLWIHPFNFRRGEKEDVLEASLMMLVSSASGPMAVPGLMPVPEAENTLPHVDLELCHACTSADDLGPAMAAGVRVMWGQACDISPPKPLQRLCTCWITSASNNCFWLVEYRHPGHGVPLC